MPDKLRPSLLRDLKHYLSGRALLLVLGFVTFPLLTRVLTPAEYGILSLSLRVILFLTVLAKCGMQYSAARFYHQDDKTNATASDQRFYSTLLLGPAITTLAVCVVYTPILLLLSPPQIDGQLYKCLLVAPILVLVRTLQTILLSFLRNEGRSFLHSAIEFSTKFLTLIAFVVVLISGFHNAFNVLIALTSSEAVVVLLQLGLLLRRKVVHWTALDWTLVRTALSFGAPLIAYELSSIILDSGDRFLVQHYLGNTSLGYYSAAYNVSNYLQEVVMSPLNLAIVPVYMRLWHDPGADATQAFLSTGLSWFILSIFTVSSATALCAHDLFIALASSKYDVASGLLPVLIPSLMIYATHIFLNVGLVLHKRTISMSVIVALTALVNLSLNAFLIPAFGLAGAAWANLLSYGLLIVALAVVNHRLLPLKLNLGVIWKGTVATTLGYIVGHAIHTSIPVLTVFSRLGAFTGVLAITFFLLYPPLRERLWRAAGSWKPSTLGIEGESR